MNRMDKNETFNPRIGYISSIVLLNMISASCFALPFSIVPNGKLPTSVPQGGTVSASYIVTNLTSYTLKNNIVRTPPHVTSNGCSPSLTLAPKASCTLDLTISGAVNKNDPNVAHHLFVCLNDRTSCAGPTPENSLNVTVSSSSIPHLVAVGGYSNGGDGLPLINLSDNHGTTWQSVVPTALVSTKTEQTALNQNRLSRLVLFGVACSTSGFTCATVGLDSINDLPYGLSTTNSGAAWNNALFSGVPSGAGFTLNGVSCAASGSACVAVGYYTNDDLSPRIVGLSYTSSNGGAAWTLSSSLPPSPASLNPFKKGGGGNTYRINSVSCSSNGLQCIAAGTQNFSEPDGGNPLLYKTTDGGSSWTGPTLPTIPTYSTNPLRAGDAGQLYGVACSSDGQQCTAVGKKQDSSLSTIVPLAYFTRNGGGLWTGALPTPPPSFAASSPYSPSYLSAVACSANGLKCIAVGYANAPVPPIKGGSTIDTPLVYTSTDGGESWSTHTYLTQPTDSTGTKLVGITCDSDGTICTAVARTSTQLVDKLSVSYTTTNGGTTWGGPVELSTPAGGDSTIITGVSGSK